MNDKYAFVYYNRFTIQFLSREYDLSPILLAGIAFNEYRGMPSIMDTIAWTVRSANKVFANLTGYESSIKTLAKDPGKTSIGDTSVQLRHFTDSSIKSQAEALYQINRTGYNATNRSLLNSAILLDQIRKDLYPNISGIELTKEQNIRILNMYNGPGKNSYGESVFKRYNQIMGALK
ncbi:MULTISPECIES: hypothetical protein [Acinetobacter]|nr:MULTISPECIES: hypothetical protein [Acinetobacter]UXJ58603.1 hypothetical protein N5P16_06380 [Acinetobacter baylyi]UXJ59896.1 hypothetical protein N5P13_12400 [Acinetobacter baylyi]